MSRLMMLLGVIALASCEGNRSDEKAGSTVKVPGDSVRLEDTLSTPPPTDSVR
jgi:hypothetical protein